MSNNQTSTQTGPAERKSRKVKLTDIFARNVKATGKRQTISDDVCRGLALRVGAKGTKTWAFMSRDCHGKSRTVTIGRYPDVPLKAARQKADQLRGVFAVPESLAEHLKPTEVVEDVTLFELMLEAERKFCLTKQIWRQRGKTNDASTARQVITTVFGEMLHRPASELTVERASELVHSYTPKSKSRTGKATANGQAC